MPRHSLTGSGTPPIVLLNGAGADLRYWRKLAPLLAAETTVLAYDRTLPPGLRRTDAPIGAPISAHVVAELRALLAAIGLGPPYLLVAHSLGGLHAQLFARLHPLEVAGLVMVDCSHPEQGRRFARQGNWLTKGSSALVAAWDRAFGPGRLTEVVRLDGMGDEIAAAPAFPDIPLSVLTAGKTPPAWLLPPKLWAMHLDNQRELAALSPRGTQFVVPDGDHELPLKRPEFVAKHVLAMLEELRNGAEG